MSKTERLKLLATIIAEAAEAAINISSTWAEVLAARAATRNAQEAYNIANAETDEEALADCDRHAPTSVQ
jgi:hypothetical protein